MSSTTLPAAALEVLHTHSLLGALTASVRDEAIAQGTWREYHRGDVLYRRGDPADLLWIVTFGWVRMYQTSRDGVDRVLGYRSRGDMLGEDGLLNPPLHQHCASVQDEASCLVLSRTAVRSLLDQHPALLQEFLKQLSGEISWLQQDLVDVSIADTRRRLACTLLSLGERYGTVDSDGSCHLQVPMTQQELASLVGAARETVSRLCTALSNVRIEKSSLTIVHWAEFKALHG